MNTNNFFNFFYNFSKSIFFLTGLFFLLSIETSLIFFPIFKTASPSLIIITIYFTIKKFNFPPSNLNLLFLGLLNDIYFGGNLGLSSAYFLLIKYLTEELSFVMFKKYDGDWLKFTFIFICSFSIIFLINILLNQSIPDISPILYHVGITLIIFPILNFGLNVTLFLTNLIKIN